MLLKKIFVIFKILIVSQLIFLTALKAAKDECDKFEELVDNKDIFNYPSQTINDLGINFKYEGVDSKKIISRDKNNFPKIYISLTESKNLVPGTTIMSINEINLSEINDDEIKNLIKNSKSATIEYFDQNKKINKIEIFAKEYELIDFNIDRFSIFTIGEVDAKKGFFSLNYELEFSHKRPDLEHEGEILKDHCIYRSNEKRFTKIYRPDKELTLQQFDKNQDKLEEAFGFYPVNGETFLSQIIKGTSKIRSKFDFSVFPFDEQTLKITIKSSLGMQDGGNEIYLIKISDSVFNNLNFFQENNYLEEWKVKNYSVNNYLRSEENKFYDNLEISLTIKRNSNYYLFKIIIPVLLILTVAWSVLWIPPKEEWVESRLTTSIVALLSLIAYNFVFLDDIPKLDILTSLDQFILWSYLFCAIPIFTTIFLSRFIDGSQKRTYQRNRTIRSIGGYIYVLVSLVIFFKPLFSIFVGS